MIVVAVQPALTMCAGCGQPNTPDARFCSACGVSLLMPPPAETLSNAVAGEPVARAARPQPQISSLPELRGRVQDVLPELRERLHEVLPEVVATLGESMQRLGGLQTTRRRPAVRGRIAAPPAPPSLPLIFARWLPAPPPPALPPPSPPLLARVAWCLLAGIWLTPLWLIGTWLCLCSVVGMPLAARMLDLAPTVLTLRSPRAAVDQSRYQGTGLTLVVSQHEALLRALYFVFVGWWASLTWMMVAYLIALTVIGMPAGYRMLELAPAVAHLQRR